MTQECDCVCVCVCVYEGRGFAYGESRYLLILKMYDSNHIINSALPFEPYSVSTIELHNIGIGIHEISMVFSLESGTRKPTPTKDIQHYFGNECSKKGRERFFNIGEREIKLSL